MFKREKPLSIQKSKKHFIVELPKPTDISILLKAPYYGVGAALSKLAGTVPETPENASDIVKIANMLPMACAIIGAFWSDEDLELENVFSLENLEIDFLQRYGTKVSQELQDYDFSLLDILDLFNACAKILKDNQSILKMAQDRASFSEAQQVS